MCASPAYVCFPDSMFPVLSPSRLALGALMVWGTHTHTFVWQPNRSPALAYCLLRMSHSNPISLFTPQKWIFSSPGEGYAVLHCPGSGFDAPNGIRRELLQPCVYQRERRCAQPPRIQDIPDWALVSTCNVRAPSCFLRSSAREIHPDRSIREDTPPVTATKSHFLLTPNATFIFGFRLVEERKKRRGRQPM